MNRAEDIRRDLAEVRSRIATAARAAGRDSASILLVAVSKTHDAAAIRAAYEAGQRDFGENYVQEMAAKMDALGDLSDVRFHMIGHLQRNKARQVVRIASAVHTVDSARLAVELARRTSDAPVPETRRFPTGGCLDARLPAFIEVNIADEAQKSGCRRGEIDEVATAIETEPALRLAGLMTVPPHTDDPAGARPFFDALVALREANGGVARFPELSMGMSHDLEYAVAAGATIVRVGTAIFGQRE